MDLPLTPHNIQYASGSDAHSSMHQSTVAHCRRTNALVEELSVPPPDSQPLHFSSRYPRNFVRFSCLPVPLLMTSSCCRSDRCWGNGHAYHAPCIVPQSVTIMFQACTSVNIASDADVNV